MGRASSAIDTIVSGASSGVESVVIPTTPSSPLLASEEQKDAIVTGVTNRLLDRFSCPIEDYDDAELANRLQEDLNDLQRMDPMIPIVRRIESGAWDLDAGSIQLGAYRVSSPSIKSLNDLYLGPIATDQFIEDLHKAIERTFRTDFEILRRFFKGGTFDLKMSETDDVTARLEELRDAMSQFHEEASGILLSHISDHMKTYEETMKAEGLDMSRLDLNDLEENSKQSKLHTSYLTLRRFYASIANETVPVEISFGVNETKSVTPKDVAFAICCAERAANMGAYRNYQSRRKNGGNHYERNPLQEYAHEYLFADLVAGRSRVYDLATEEEGDDVQIKPEWQPFFELDSKNKLRMTENMIAQHRRDDYEEGLNPEALDAFSSYYAAINEVDVLRNFRVADFDRYLNRSKEIASLAEEIEKVLKNDDTPREELEKLLQKASDELEISIKDEHDPHSPKDAKQVVGRTQRAVIRALMSDGPKVLLMGDHIGFGIRNVQSNERLVTGLIEKLGLTPAEERLNNQNHELFLSVIKRRLDEMPPSYWDTLFAIGDPGTAYLRRTEAAIVEHFGGEIISDANGGDEMTMVIPVPNQGLPEQRFFDRALEVDASRAAQNRLKYELNQKLTGVLARARIRAAAILIPEPLRPGDGQRYTRALRYAEGAHKRIKRLGGVFVMSDHEKNLAE